MRFCEVQVKKPIRWLFIGLMRVHHLKPINMIYWNCKNNKGLDTNFETINAKNISTVYLLVGNGRNKNSLHTFGCLCLFVHSVYGKCSPFANMAASEYWAQLESMQWKIKNVLQTIAAIGWVPPVTLNSRIRILLSFRSLLSYISDVCNCYGSVKGFQGESPLLYTAYLLPSHILHLQSALIS